MVEVSGVSQSVDPSLATSTGDADQTRQLGDEAGAVGRLLDGLVLRPGEHLGRYVVLRELGSGGMSVVYVAYDPELDRQVALKLMRPGSSSTAQDSAQRLQREARALARVSHPNVVHVYDVGTYDEHVYLAMELIEGKTLRQWLEQPRSWQEVVDVMTRAGEGLAAAHHAGLIHRDFKPSNVLVGEDGRVRVLDFGLAREPKRDSSPAGARPTSGFESMDSVELSQSSGRLDPLTEIGAVMGTPGYMAPEQLLGEDADARSDQFAFCVTLYQALYGQRPFRGADRKTLDRAVLTGKRRDPPSNRHVPSRLRRVIDRGLALRPEDRFADMAALLEQLRPPSTRARGWVLGGLTVCGAVGLTAWVVRGDAGGVHCGPPVWSAWDDRGQEVRAAFQRTDVPFATEAFRGVDGVLTRYVADWGAMHIDACEATHVRGEQSEHLLDLRMACLQQARAEAEALIDVLAGADALTVQHARDAVDKLASLKRCADSAALRSDVQVPDDPAVKAEVDAIGRELARVLALHNAGRYPQADLQIQPLLQRASDLEHPVTRARVSQLAGRIKSQLGRGKEAQAFFDEAVWAAERAGADHIRANALTELAFVTANVVGDPDRADWYWHAAEAAVTRIGDPDLERSDLYANRSVIATMQGDPERALELARKSLELRPDSETSPEERATTLSNIGSALFTMGRYEEALQFYEQSRETRGHAYGPEHPAVAIDFENLGNALTAMGRFEEGIKEHLRAIEILEGAGVGDGARAAILLNNIAVSYNGMNLIDDAERYWLRALSAWDEADSNHPARAVVMCNLGEIDRKRGEHREAIERYRAARDLLNEILGPEHMYTSVALAGLGRSYVDVERFEEAVPLLRTALSVQEGSTEDTTLLAETKFHLARALWHAGPREEARAIAREAALTIEGKGRGIEARDEVMAWVKEHGIEITPAEPP